MEICQPSLCTGCTACYSKCPKNSITMTEDGEGFLRPVIDEATCISCGVCQKVCPANNNLKLNTPFKVYAGWDNDSDSKSKSSSGGIGTLLAQKFINHGGVVCGAVFSNGTHVCHRIITSIEDIDKLRGSKYIQSSLVNCYTQIKNILDSKKPVLFIGTPCQVSGLKSFVGSNQSFLYTVDLICHGTPSHKVLQSYIADINKSFGCTIDSCTFRDDTGYNLCFKEKSKTIYSKEFTADLFGIGFLRGLFNRPVCYHCKYAQRDRCGDITIGDFWGIGSDFIEKYHPKNGLSVIMQNTEKSAYLIDFIKDNAFLCPREIDEAVNGNKQLRFPSHKHKNRTKFFATLPQKGFSKTSKICLTKELLGYKAIKLINKVKK